MPAPRSTLTRHEIAYAVRESLGRDFIACRHLVDDFLELVVEALETEGRLLIQGFGAFDVVEKKPRRGRNPHTGEDIMLPARRVVRFQPSKLLRDDITEAFESGRVKKTPHIKKVTRTSGAKSGSKTPAPIKPAKSTRKSKAR